MVAAHVVAHILLWIAGIIGSIVGALLMAWYALIVQAMAGRGEQATFFASELLLRRPPDNDDIVELLADFDFFDSNGKLVRSKKGLRSDGASVQVLLDIPILGTFVIWLIEGTPLTGPLSPAAIPHDELYAEATDRTLWRALISMERAHADRIIYEAATTSRYVMSENGMIVHRRTLRPWRAFIVMALLRVVGCFAWLADSRAGVSLRALETAATVTPFRA